MDIASTVPGRLSGTQFAPSSKRATTRRSLAVGPVVHQHNHPLRILGQAQSLPDAYVGDRVVGGEGVDELAAEIDVLLGTFHARMSPESRRARRGRYIVERLAIESIRTALDDDTDPDVRAVMNDVLDGKIDPAEAASRLLLRQ